MTRSIGTLAIAGVLLAASPVTAGTPAQQIAKDCAAAGAAALAAGRADEALAHYAVAIAHDARPDYLMGAAGACEKLGRAAEAKALLERALATARDNKVKEAARQRLAALSGKAPTGGTGKLALTVVPMGAEIRVEDVLWGRSPMGPIALPAGTHRVEVRLAGYGTWSANITIQAGQTTSTVVTLTPGGTPAPKPAHVEPAPGAPSAPAGAWAGARWKPRAAQETHERFILTLSGQSGSLTVESRRPLPSWKRAGCQNASEATWTTTYSARLAALPGGQRLLATGGRNTACSCAGNCPFDPKIDVPMLGTADGRALVSDDLVLWPGSPDDKPFQETPAVGALAGTWTVRFAPATGEVGGSATLDAQGSGTIEVTSVTPLAKWRRGECGGKETLTAVHHLSVRATVKGKGIALDIRELKRTDCSCEKLCGMAKVSAPSGRVRVSADGLRLVSPEVVLTRR